ncbi:hypothetical protein FLACOL7796_00911 [Flavobacterium collinsii]|jgi:plasmid maintenance system antidote protein VapI|uniref:HTH cro/C1-type domain-containing protein n=1 Tax=Flavobacterium collinsii TaxID=1114861 RepID=A0ABM8KEX9_9FLAO|nr:hypothetical protein FLACOL7796_00911 [Flavobacterium collinsii]
MMSEEFLINLAQNISVRAKAKFNSNLEFAPACNVDETSIRRILKGKQNFSINIVLKIYNALDIKMSELL